MYIDSHIVVKSAFGNFIKQNMVNSAFSDMDIQNMANTTLYKIIMQKLEVAPAGKGDARAVFCPVYCVKDMKTVPHPCCAIISNLL